MLWLVEARLLGSSITVGHGYYQSLDAGKYELPAMIQRNDKQQPGLGQQSHALWCKSACQASWCQDVIHPGIILS